jgi:DNA polymerase I-like protein with 3'-5' exonuclease and polymerase domains
VINLPKRSISLDTEVTGLDIEHGAKPFLVTISDAEGANTYWEWDVNPVTRIPQIPKCDLAEIDSILEEADEIILQNPVYDVRALSSVPREWSKCGLGTSRFWSKVRDTLLAGHLLKSSQKHDLTTMVLVYLGVNVQPLEDAVKAACKKARTWARGKRPHWRIAKEGLPEMPSVKKRTSGKDRDGSKKDAAWKNDLWLPRAVAKELNYPGDHPWWLVTADYANGDSAVLPFLYRRMKQLLEDQGLWNIYEKMRLHLLEVNYSMQTVGISLDEGRFDEKYVEFKEGYKKASQSCLDIAANYEFDLDLPKGNRNNSLVDFAFNHLKLPVVARSKKTGQPSLKSSAIDEYKLVLDAGSDQLEFVTSFNERTVRGTALSYMDGYKRFWIKGNNGACLLHPNLNPTGSATLRWSCSNPNEQNISKKDNFNLRYMFGPAPGREWWSLDANNIELRIPAYEAEEKDLISLFENPNDPPFYGSEHLLNFSTVYQELWESELKEVGEDKVGPHCKDKYKATWYQWCKNGDFAIGYGSQKANADKTFRKEGAYELLKSRFAKKEALNQKYIQFANKHGYVETIPDKDIDPLRGYPLWCARTRWGKIKPTIPLNYHVSGTAMWWMCRAMTKCHNFLVGLTEASEWNLGKVRAVYSWITQAIAEALPKGYYLIMQVHDELVFDFPYIAEKGNLPVVKQIKNLMESCGDGVGIPTPCSAEYHQFNWSEGVTVA